MEQKKSKARKRGVGEGSIFKRADGRWAASATIGRTPTGKQRKRVVYGATRAEAAEKLRELTNSVAAGTLADPGRLTVADLCTRYLEHVQRTVRPTTLALYEQTLASHVRTHLGGAALARLSPVHVLAWLGALGRAEVGPRAQQVAFDVLKRMLAFGVEAEILSRNPAARVKRPRAPKPEVRSLTAEQAKKLLAKAHEGAAWVEAAVALGLCGLRRGETFGLTWGDVNLESGRVRIRQAAIETSKGERSIGEPKSKSARREVPLPSFAMAALHRHRAALAARPLPSVLVFSTAEGTPVRFSNFSRRHFAKLVEAAGKVEDGTPREAAVPKGTTYHALRHTAATLLLAGGADVKSAQRVLGHAQASHTLDVYADFVPDRVDDAMERLDRALRG
jgi:integrase